LNAFLGKFLLNCLAEDNEKKEKVEQESNTALKTILLELASIVGTPIIFCI